MEPWKLLVAGLFIIGLLETGLAKPATDNGSTSTSKADDQYAQDEEDYQGDDDYHYDDDDNSSSDKDKPSSTNIESNAPVLDVTHYSKSVRPGEGVTLECNVKNRADSTIIMWYNRTQLLTQSKYKLSLDPRISIDDNFSLEIRDVRPTDEGEYFCKVLPNNLMLRVNLEVQSPPSVRIIDNSRDVTQHSVTYRAGDRITIECLATGKPTPIITWASKGTRLGKSNGVTVEGNILIIERADHNSAAIYQCLADNGIGVPAHGTVTVNVQYAPHVTEHKPVVNSGEGYDAELHCTFSSDPMGRTAWRHNNKPLDAGAKYQMSHDVHNHHNRSILVIKKVERTDLGDYECEMSNKIGRGKANIQLTFAPELAHFDEYEIRPDHVQLNWTIHSVQPLSEVTVYYRKSGKKQWLFDRPIIVEPNHEHSGIWKIQHKLVLEAGTWHTNVRAKNTEGWSKHSESQSISIPKITYGDDEHDNDDAQNGLEATTNENSGATNAAVMSFICLLPIIMVNVFTRVL